MVALPAIEDPTLAAVDRALEERGNAGPARPYLGMSIIGKECERELWLTFRWVGRETFDAATLKRFEDGHRGEDLQADRLRLVDGIKLYTHDPATGRQFAVEDCGGHVRGHMDGAILGIFQAPKTFHVWEHKQVGEKKQGELVSLKAKFGEKDALFQWNPVYYWQGQGYMGYTGMTRHYLTAASPGGRHTVSVRADYDETAFLQLRAKARRIVFGARPPAGISQDPTFFKCKWCAFHAHCHEAKWPDAGNCRTCLHATPEEDGTWSCARFGRTLSVDEQRQGCPAHLYIPDLIPAEQVDAGPDWVGYRLADGTEWRDGAAHDGGLREMTKDDLCPYGSSGDTCAPLMEYDVCICRLRDRAEAAEAQVAALLEALDGLIALTEETARHSHQASDWHVYASSARTALNDTAATAARVIREAEARGMEMGAEVARLATPTTHRLIADDATKGAGDKAMEIHNTILGGAAKHRNGEG